MNKIMLIGNLGKDPEMNYTPSGIALTKFPLAVNRFTKTSTGEKEKETDWFNIIVWRQLAETCNTYLHKGSKVYIEGRLSQRKYTDKNGIERWMTEVIASDMEMLTPKSEQSGSSSEFLAGNADDTDPLGDLEDHPF
jgi:single-strand DNA-binding protein